MGRRPADISRKLPQFSVTRWSRTLPALFVPGEIEEAVIGEIDEGFPVTDALIANVQTVGLIQRINNADVQIPGEARFAVRTGPEEADAVREQFRVPKLLVKAGFEIRVEIAAVVVVREPVFNAVQYKSCPRDTVGMPADGGTEKAAGFILRQRIVAEDHIPGNTVRAGNKETHEDRAVIRQNGTHTAAVLYGKEVCMAARPGNAEIRLFYQHGKVPFLLCKDKGRP